MGEIQEWGPVLADEQPDDQPRDQLALVLQATSRAMTACCRRGLGELGLSYPQYVVMLVLWEHGQVSMRYLCRTLELDTGTLSPLVKRLESRGLVTRHRDPSHERLVLVAATEADRALRGRARTVAAGVERATGMSAPEVTALRAQLNWLACKIS
jgi:DNA-binding MarR family transcriptional regulator